MPNYVYNSFSIEGLTKDQKSKIESAIKEGQFFNFVVPEPKWEEIPFKGQLPEKVTITNQNADGSEFSYTVNRFADKSQDDRWYGWRISNWGTKWPESDGNLLENNDDSTVEYFFNTAWSPLSDGFLKALSNLFPNAKIWNYFVEEDSFYGGSVATSGKSYTCSAEKNDAFKDWLIENHPDKKDLLPSIHDLYEDGNEDICEEWEEVEGDVFNDLTESELVNYKF